MLREQAPDILKIFKAKNTKLFRLENPPKYFLVKAQKAVLTYFVRFSFKYWEFEWYKRLVCDVYYNITQINPKNQQIWPKNIYKYLILKKKYYCRNAPLFSISIFLNIKNNSAILIWFINDTYKTIAWLLYLTQHILYLINSKYLFTKIYIY